MFTGIIEELGQIRQITSNKLEIVCTQVLKDTKIGDSISVNGVCLTVTKFLSDGFIADMSQETLQVTALDELKSGDYVNLERAMPANGRFGGHFVSGHIDGCGKLVESKPLGEFYSLKVELHPEQAKYVIKKGK